MHKCLKYAASLHTKLSLAGTKLLLGFKKKNNLFSAKCKKVFF